VFPPRPTVGLSRRPLRGDRRKLLYPNPTGQSIFCAFFESFPNHRRKALRINKKWWEIFSPNDLLELGLMAISPLHHGGLVQIPGNY
jgi:hypothetical protein